MPKKSADTNSAYMWDNSYPNGTMPRAKRKPGAVPKKPAASAKKYPKPVAKGNTSVKPMIPVKPNNSAGVSGSRGGRTVSVPAKPKTGVALPLKRISRPRAMYNK